MKRRFVATAALVSLLTTGGAFAAGPGAIAGQSAAMAAATACRHTSIDPGAVPYVFNIDKATVKNTNFRTAAWTADTLQVTLMSIPVGGDVGLEMHPAVNQFFRVEKGTARVMMGTSTALTYVKDVSAGDVILIPAGTWHDIVNTGATSLKLYSLYGPQQHPQGTIHVTEADDPHSKDAKPTPIISDPTPVTPFTADPGAVPFVTNIVDATMANTNFRTAAWTSSTLQLTLMDIKVGGEVGLEMHPKVDQFLRVESGKGKVYFGTSKDTVKFYANVRPGDAILVPSGTWHNIVNASPKESLKLYSLYGPQQHPQGTIHVTPPAE